MREKAFEIKVKKLLEEYGCWVLKTWSNGVQRSGVPDLLVCCDGYFIGVELKAERGKPSKLQLYNLRKIRDSGGFAWLLYPNMFDDFKLFIKLLVEGSGDELLAACLLQNKNAELWKGEDE